MKDNNIIFENVTLGKRSIIESYCIIGISTGKKEHDTLQTIIGTDAHIRSHTVIYSGNKIGNNFQTGNKVNIRELNKIGENVNIGTLTVIEHHVCIGTNVRIHSQAFIPEYTIIEDNAWIGPNTVLTNAKYPLSPEAKNNLKGPVIKQNAKICANVTVLPGVRIGENALVGAGAIVTRNVKDGAVVVGNPARQIADISELPY